MEAPSSSRIRHLAGVPVGEPASETNHQIGVQKVPVPDGLPDLDSGVAGIERVGIRKPALAHVSHDEMYRVVSTCVKILRASGHYDGAIIKRSFIT